jgi:phospholipase C
LSTSTTPANSALIPTSGVCGKAAPGAVGNPRCGYGIRIPFLVISPWAKRNYVDHTVTDQTSSLAFIEFNWGLGFLDGPTAPAEGTASFDRFAGSILTMFDFDSAPHLRPLILNDITGLVAFGDDDRDDHGGRGRD